MFGYIKPDKENLLVKDLALYKAVYCGLCSVIKKNVSFLLPFTLSYDFVFLAMIRSALSEENSYLTKGRCKYNPLKKCNFSVCSNETVYVANSALMLTVLKLQDDIRDKDTSFWKRIILKPFYKALSKKLKAICKDEIYSELYDLLQNKLRDLAEIELSASTDLDVACCIFGDIMSDITSFSLSDKKASIAKEIGCSIGRYIYLIDAIDDIDKDHKSGAYNPLIAKYGSIENAKSHFNELDVAVAVYAQCALLATNLLKENEYTRIIENTISRGLGAEAYRIMTKNGDKK